eukprot:479818-Pyramimonas_sp.AAC.1
METSDESFNLLQLIANDCYKCGAFFYAAKAFDVLERLDPSPEYWEGKRGACVGVFQVPIEGNEWTTEEDEWTIEEDEWTIEGGEWTIATRVSPVLQRQRQRCLASTDATAKGYS